jgi:hypothetical protein
MVCGMRSIKTETARNIDNGLLTNAVMQGSEKGVKDKGQAVASNSVSHE